MSDPAHNDVEQDETADGRVRSIAVLGGERGTCGTCDYWQPRLANSAGMEGWCNLFVKRTTANHGRQCTGWTPLEPPNDES